MTPAPEAERDATTALRQLELHVRDVDQLFNSIDPAPFRERDLDPNAEEFIVGWAREEGPGPLSLRICLDRALEADEERVVPGAVQEYFKHRGVVTRQRLRQTLQVGRTSLIIGVLFLAASIFLGDLLETALRSTRFGGFVRESLLIGGWVAMWKPLEVFLYDWWPIRDEARLFERLGTMRVNIEREPAAESEAPQAATLQTTTA